MTNNQHGKDCPYSQFEGYDFLYSSLGNYVCTLRKDYGEYGETQGHPDCDTFCNDYSNCGVYKKQKGLEGEIKNEN